MTGDGPASTGVRVTIGVTCYNARDTIRAALDGAAAQTWPDTQIVVVDDASTDGSADIIRNFIADRPDKNFVFIARPVNEGYPAALNTIIAAASGTYVAFMDDDDISRPDRIELQLARLVAYDAGPAFCYSDRLVIPENGQPHEAKAIGRRNPEPYGPMVADFILWSQGRTPYSWGMFGSCTLTAPLDLLKKLGGFDPAFRRCAEWDLAIRHALNNGHFIAVDQPLITQRKTAGSDKGGRKPLLYALQLRTKYRDFLIARHTYSGARLVARSRFYGASGHAWTARFFYAGAALLSLPIFIERVRRVRP